jgi:CheY-like chemotaxis protein
MPMPLNALVMCREQQSLRVLSAAMDDLQIEGQACDSAPEALDLMARGHYSALVLDFDLPNAVMVARMGRLAPAHRRPVVFAMIGALTEISGTFQAGANFVLFKPLVCEQILRSLRAGRGFMKSDHRRSPRHKLEALAYLQFGTGALPAMVLDLNEDGLALQAPEPLPPVQEVPLRFVLPGTPHLVEGLGEVIWVDDVGRAGILFTQLLPASQKHLKSWLAKRSGGKKAGSRNTPSPKKKPVSAAALY